MPLAKNLKRIRNKVAFMSKMLNEVKNSQPINEKVETNAENDVI